MILIQRRHYPPPDKESDDVKEALGLIEPHMKSINDELRKAGLVGPGRELAVHVTSQSEDLRTVLLWRDDN